jgi:hypothetical protein
MTRAALFASIPWAFLCHPKGEGKTDLLRLFLVHFLFETASGTL